MNFLVPLFMFTMVATRVVGQDTGFTSVPGCPCPEIYDLMRDSRGYIWMAHDYGLSRYDGRNFISFSNPRQNALAVTDLTEDPQGRIWCHNFAGQIFYVEGFRLHLLDTYDFESEGLYPRIGICGDELVATSGKGLFTLNTKTFVSRYYHFSGGSTTLTVLRNKVLLYGDGQWHLYQPGSGVTVVKDSVLRLDKTWNLSLQPKGLEDTAYFIQNPEGSYYRLYVRDNNLCLAGKRTLNSFINAITIDSGDVWVHMRAFSWCERTRETLEGINLTDLIRDAYGNSFASSLKGGLLVRYRSSYTERMNPLYPEKGDFIRRLMPVGDRMICGTQNGTLLLLDRDFSRIGELTVPGKDIPIEILYPLDTNEFLVGTTIGTFWLNFSAKQLRLIDKDLILKDVICVGQTMYLATNRELRSIACGRLLHFTGRQLHRSDYTVIRQGRTRAIGKRIEGKRTTVLCSFNDGLYEITDDSQRRLLHNGQPVYATAITTVRNKTVIGTFSEGLLILDGEHLTELSDRDGLLSNSIRGIRPAADGIWLLSFSGALQKMDSNFHFVSRHVATFRFGAIYDVLERDRQIYVATNTSLYHTIPVPKSEVAGRTVVDFILINGKDSALDKEVFRNDENNLQIHLSTPFFHPIDFLRYKYRVLDQPTTKANWAIADDDQKTFSLAALRPGQYIFEAVAVDPIGEEIAPPLRQRIEIRPAWYQTRSFLVGVMLLAAILTFLGVRLFFLSRLREQQARLERELAVERERQRISADLHDDIGSTLSSINIYTGLAKKKGEYNEWYFNVISQHVNMVIEKLDDLVWSINPKYDSIGDIARRLLAYADPAAGAKGIAVSVSIDPEAVTSRPRQDVKNQLYLIGKELVNNAVKHSGCSTILIGFACMGDMVIVTVADDGSGISTADLEKGRNGIANTRTRVAHLGGRFELQRREGGGTCAVIEVPV